MKKFNQWFNRLSSERQRLVFAAFCFGFTLLLILSIKYSTVLPAGSQSMPNHIGLPSGPQFTDSLTHKK
jgi:hypothetical protein